MKRIPRVVLSEEDFHKHIRRIAGLPGGDVERMGRMEGYPEWLDRMSTGDCFSVTTSEEKVIVDAQDILQDERIGEQKYVLDTNLK